MSTESTPIHNWGSFENNVLYVKREDLLPFSFGGNKARKAELFFREIDGGAYDCVVTYGSSSSNHCRIVSNLCAARSIPCYIISPQEASTPTFNSAMMDLFGAGITVVPTERVHDTIEEKLAALRSAGKRPYFIPGGGHGNLGTQAYVNCFEEISAYEAETGVRFDYIFSASGTGTTQAGLICGNLLHDARKTVVGISIARKNPRGRNIVKECVTDYLNEKITESEADRNTIFIDDYTDGYGTSSAAVRNTVTDVLKRYGVPMDTTYVGKAFYGMTEYLRNHRIERRNILFIHTGGTPLFFDFLTSFGKESVK